MSLLMQLGSPALAKSYDAKAVALPANASTILSADGGANLTGVGYTVMDGVRPHPPRKPAEFQPRVVISDV